MVYWWYTGGILVVYGWYTGGIRVVYVVYGWYTGGIRVVYGWYTYEEKKCVFEKSCMNHLHLYLFA